MREEVRLRLGEYASDLVGSTQYLVLSRQSSAPSSSLAGDYPFQNRHPERSGGPAVDFMRLFKIVILSEAKDLLFGGIPPSQGTQGRGNRKTASK